MTRINKYIPMLLIAFFFAACSDEVKYEPAEPVTADNWGVFFDGENDTEYARAVSDPNKLELVLRRANTTGEVTVPIDAEIIRGEMTAPGSVTFANGQETATYTVTYGGLDKGKVEFVLSIPEMYINPYVQKNGFAKQKIVIFEPTVVSNKVVMAYDATSTGSTTAGTFDKEVYTITQIPGENRFYWNNFLNSGLTLAFKVDGNFDPDNVRNCYGNIVPLNHFMTDPEDEYGWYFCTENDATENGTIHSWTHKGVEISEIYFYWGTYSYIDFGSFGENYGYGQFAPFTQDDEWIYYNFYIYYE